jgi:hypothetical protein
MNTTRAYIRDIITGLVLATFLAAMTPSIGRALNQIQGSIQNIHAHAGMSTGGEL